MAGAGSTLGNLSSSDMLCLASGSPSTSPAAERKGLRRVRDDIPLRLWIVASISFWEKAAFWGLTAPWQNYMQHLPRLTSEETPGALGLGQAKATRIYCAFYIAYYFSPMCFAILSDSHLGRYRTLLACLTLFNIGAAAMTFSSLPSSLANGWGIAGLIISMVCVALGGGGFESNMSAFLVDQYVETEPRIKRLGSREEVITDRTLTIEYIYSLNYWIGNVGSLSWFAVVALEEHAGFTAAYGLTFVFIFLSLVTLFVGKGYFIRVPHESGIFAQASRILLCASRNGFRLARADPKYQLEHRRKVVPWSSELVCELRRGLRGCRVLLAFIVFYICFDQMQNNLISQSAQMETGSTPNDMLPAMNQVGCILFAPLIHHVIYPLLHKRHIYLKPITRITIGFGFVVASMAYAAIVQNAIYSTGPCYAHPRACSLAANREPNHVNVWLQAPIFFLIAMGEVWAYVTALEIAYSHAPKNMKSMIQAIFPIMAGIGSASAMGLSPIAHDPNLVIFYASLAGAMAVTTVVFRLVFRKHDNNGAEDETDEYAEGAKAPSVEDSPRDSVSEGTDVESGIELGSICAYRSSSVPVTLKRFDIAASTHGNGRLESMFTSYGAHGGMHEFTSSPHATQHEAAKQAIITVPKAAHPVQLLPSSSRSLTQKTGRVQERQPRFSMTPAEPLPAYWLSDHRRDNIERPVLSLNSSQDITKSHPLSGSMLDLKFSFEN